MATRNNYPDIELEDVREFHKKFDQLDAETPSHLTKRKLAERANFMLEELTEFAEGAGLRLQAHVTVDPMFLATFESVRFVPVDIEQDIEMQVDSLIDLCYVLKGTAAMMGLAKSWTALWDDVQRANMAKVKGPTHRNAGSADICKPNGWRGPDTLPILFIYGYDRDEWTSIDGDHEHTIYVIDDAKCLDDPDRKEWTP